MESFAAECLERHGSRIFWCSDELYLKAGRDVPGDEYYEEYSQLENGVGLMTLLETEFAAALDAAEADEGTGEPFAIATGVAAAPLLEKLLQTGHKKCDKINGRVYAVVNDFFGHTIDVAGLITGRDLIAQLKGRELGARLLIPQQNAPPRRGRFPRRRDARAGRRRPSASRSCRLARAATSCLKPCSAIDARS